MPVLISMFLATLIWSLYPLAVTMGLQTMTSFEMIMIVYIFSGVGAIIIGLIQLFKTKTIKQTIEITKSLPIRAFTAIIVSGIAGVLCHGFFIIALTLANKGGVSLLYESWPVIAVVATPFLMRKTWKEVSFREFMISLLALVGVGIVILSGEDLNLFSNKPEMLSDQMDYTALGGYILAFAGGYMCAVLVVLKGVFAEYYEDLHNDISSTLISEIFSRITSMLLMITAFIFLEQNLNIEAINWGASFFVGFIVFVVGGALYTYALLNTDRPTIHIIYYFVPVLAVVWLWIAGETTVNYGLAIGGAIILGSNLYLTYANRDKASAVEV